MSTTPTHLHTGRNVIEELVVNIISNAPAVVVLFYLVVRLDNRLQAMEETLIELVRGQVDKRR